jgi:hypothetical protein
MSDEPKKPRSASKWVAIFLVLYVLGIGPVQRLPPDVQHALGWVYYPFYFISQYRVPGTVLARYVNLWLPRTQRAVWDARMGILIEGP